MTPPSLQRLPSDEETEPLFRVVSTDVDTDPLESFTPESRMDPRPSVDLNPPIAVATPQSLEPQVTESVSAFVEGINDVEKHIEQHFAALDERSRHTEERLRAFETLVAEMRAKVRALDDSIETRMARSKATTRRLDSILLGPPQQSRRSRGLSLSAVGVLAVLALVGVVTMRSLGDADQTTARTPVPQPPPPARPVTSSATFPVPFPIAAPADPPGPPPGAAPTSAPVVTLKTDRPSAHRERPVAKRQLRTIERQPEVFLGTLAVRSAPDGAAVFLNGRAVGTTPLRLPGVRAGTYALRIEHEGYQRWTASVLVPADKQTDINAKLDVPDVRSR